MTLSEISSAETLIPRWLAVAFLVTSALGFLDATYLTVEHYRGVVPPCSIVSGCEAVTTSRYATVSGMPVALLGALYYLTILVLAVAYLDRRQSVWLRLAAYLTFVGLAASVWLVYLQLFVIKAICLYCLFSAATSTILWGLGITVLVLGRGNADRPSENIFLSS